MSIGHSTLIEENGIRKIATVTFKTLVDKKSMLNRKRSAISCIKSWITLDLLTTSLLATILILRCTFSVGISSPFKPGGKPQSLAVFLCPSFSAALIRVYSVMAGCFRQSSDWPFPGYGTANLTHPAAQASRHLVGGYSLY